MPLAAADRQPLCRDSTPVARRVTRAFGSRPTDSRGDRRRHARRRRARSRPPAARADRRALARRAAHPRSTGTHRGRPGPSPWLAARPPRQGRQTTRGRHGRMGLGTAPALGRRSHRATHWPAVLRHERHNTRTTVVKRRRARRAAPGRRACRRASTLCPAPAAPRPRCSPRPVAPTGARVRAKAASLSLEQLGRSRAAACDVYPDGPAPRESAAVASARAVRSMAVKRSDHERIARGERAAAVGTGTPASASQPRRRYWQA
jgi:hypothetical protein